VSPISRTSSLFDAFELASVSRRINDGASLDPALPTRPRSLDSPRVYVPHGEGPSEIRPELFGDRPFEIRPNLVGLPTPVRPPGAFAPRVPGLTAQESLIIQQGGKIPQGVASQEGNKSPKWMTRNSSHRSHLSNFSLPCVGGSISEALSEEEITRHLGIDIKKGECAITRADHENEGMHACLHFRRIVSALHEFMHLPEFDYHPQKNHHEHRHLHHLHLNHLRVQRSLDPKEYHHHLHYQLKFRDGVHQVRKAFGKSLGRSFSYWCFQWCARGALGGHLQLNLLPQKQRRAVWESREIRTSITRSYFTGGRNIVNWLVFAAEIHQLKLATHLMNPILSWIDFRPLGVGSWLRFVVHRCVNSSNTSFERIVDKLGRRN
jgi:hypothetical protein